MKRTALLVFARYPVAGRVKTRLARTTSDAFAADLYALCLRGVLDALEAVPAERTVWVADAADVSRMERLAGPGWRARPQPDGDLTHRLEVAFETSFSEGAEQVIVTATDTPGLTDAVVRRAHAELAVHDAVIGPATDGGYYLLGLRRWPLPVFEDMAWSTDSVAERTRRHLRETGCSWTELGALPDVDTEEDLRGWVRDHADGPLAAWVRADGRLR